MRRFSPRENKMRLKLANPWREAEDTFRDKKGVICHRKLKYMIARWLARRIETQTRWLRRSLRDYERVRRVIAADRRERGLRLYAAWSLKEKAAMNLREDCALAAATLCGGLPN